MRGQDCDWQPCNDKLWRLFRLSWQKQGHNRIVIKDGAYIGMRANITARHDLEIGADAVVGAGTLVNKSVPDGATCVGVPGRLITCYPPCEVEG